MKADTNSNIEWDSWVELYDLEHNEWTNQDLPFYLARSREAQPVLELACGTGRLTIPIAQAGIPIVGIDYSTKMLTRARAKAGDLANLELIEARMEDFSLDDQKFGLIFIAYSGFLVLKNVAAQEETLRNCRRHLKPGGQLVMDMFVPNTDELGVTTADTTMPMADLHLVNRLKDPQTGHTSLIWEAVSHNPNEQTFHADRIIQTFNDEGQQVGQTRHAFTNGRYVHHFEMYHLLRLCGYQSIKCYGDFHLTPFGPSSKRMIWVAAPAIDGSSR